MAIGKGSVNKVILVGNLGADPELNQTKNAAAVTTLALATNEIRKDSEGEKHDHTEWHRVVLWRRLAEIAVEVSHERQQDLCGGQPAYKCLGRPRGQQTHGDRGPGRKAHHAG